MPVELYQVLSEAGPLAAFAAYLAWMQVKSGQRHDALVEKFQTQIDRLEDKRDADEEKLRVRYDVVIDKNDTERKEMLEKLISGVNEGLAEMRSHYAQIEAERLAKMAARQRTTKGE